MQSDNSGASLIMSWTDAGNFSPEILQAIHQQLVLCLQNLYLPLQSEARLCHISILPLHSLENSTPIGLYKTVTPKQVKESNY